MTNQTVSLNAVTQREAFEEWYRKNKTRWSSLKSIAWSSWQAAQEMAFDVAAYDEAKRKLASGEDEIAGPLRTNSLGTTSTQPELTGEAHGRMGVESSHTLNLEPQDTADLQKLSDHLYALDSGSKEARLIGGALITIRSCRAEVARLNKQLTDVYAQLDRRSEIPVVVNEDARIAATNAAFENYEEDIGMTGQHILDAIKAYLAALPKRELVEAKDLANSADLHLTQLTSLLYKPPENDRERNANHILCEAMAFIRHKEESQ